MATTIRWPLGLPKQQLGVEVGYEPNVVRTKVESGPPKVRRRSTRALRTLRVPLTLYAEQRDALEAFYRDTLKDGTLSFLWEDPATDAEVELRFREPPRFRLVAGGQRRIWSTELVLEVL